MKLCNASGTIYTDIGTQIPFKVENVEPEFLSEIIKGIKDFYVHKTKFDSMGLALGNIMVDLTRTIAVDFEDVEEFERDTDSV